MMSLKQKEFGNGWLNHLYVEENAEGNILFHTVDEDCILTREGTKELIKFLIELTNEEIDDN